MFGDYGSDLSSGPKVPGKPCSARILHVRKFCGPLVYLLVLKQHSPVD